MTQKLPAVKAKDLIRVVERYGFVFRRRKGSHAIFVREADKVRIVIPVRPGKDVKPKTPAGILEDMNLSREDVLKLL